MDEEEIEMRQQLKLELWKLAVMDLRDSGNSAHVAAGSHKGAYSGGSSNNTGRVSESEFSMEQFNLTVQGAKLQAAVHLVEARKIEDAYAAAGKSDDPDLVEMSAQVDKVGDLGVVLHHLWNEKRGVGRVSECDKTGQVESFIKAVGT